MRTIVEIRANICIVAGKELLSSRLSVRIICNRGEREGGREWKRVQFMAARGARRNVIRLLLTGRNFARSGARKREPIRPFRNAILFHTMLFLI